MTNIKHFNYSQILGWSVSRYEKFLLCKRQYFYDYYAKYDHEFPLKRINALKAMTSVPLETGNIAHDVIKALLERFLKSEAEIDKTRLFDFIKKKTEEYTSSKVFAEIYYNEINKVNTHEINKAVTESVDNFLKSDRYRWILSNAIFEKKGWIIEPAGYGETRIDGLKAYCKVDFLFPIKDKIFILDWKTGKVNDQKHKKQLLGYSLWASFHFSALPKDISPVIAYLYPKYHEIELAVTEEDITRFNSLVKKETEEMYLFCINKEDNIPLEKDRFIKTTNQNICRYCNYRELCLA